MTILLLQAGAVRDTVIYVQQKPGWQQWIEALAAVAQIVLAIALLAVGIGVLVAAMKVKALIKKVEEQGQKLRVDLAPAIRNVTLVSENAVSVSKSVRGDVDRLSAGVTAATEKLKDAAEVAEQRVGEFNALIGVVQEEAEELFIGSAAALRGVRAGTETFRRFRTGELEYLGEVSVEQEEDDGLDDDDYDEEDEDQIEVEFRRGPQGRDGHGDDR